MKYSKRAVCFAAEFSNSQQSCWNPFPLESAFLSCIYYITTLFLKAYLAPLQKCQLGFQWTCIDLICRLCSLCFTLWNPRWRFEAKRQAFRSLAELLSWSISLPVTFPGYRPPHHRYLSQGLYCLRLLVELGWWESLTGSSGRGWGSHDVALPNVAIRQGCPAATG